MIRSSLATLCLSLLLFVTIARAEADHEAGPSSPEPSSLAIYPRTGGLSQSLEGAALPPPEPMPATSPPLPSYAIDPTEGFGVLSLPLELGILGAGGGEHEPRYAGGVTLRILGRRTTFPVMFGLGVGFMVFDQASQGGGPSTTFSSGDLTIGHGTFSSSQSIELRHAEVIARVQPWWGFARPFVELELGIAALWDSSKLQGPTGRTVAAVEEQRSVSVLYGGSIGVDWRLHCGKPGPSWTSCFMLTTAVKHWGTGPMTRPDYINGADGVITGSSSRAPLSLWIPYIALTIAFDSRAGSRRVEPLPTQ